MNYNKYYDILQVLPLVMSFFLFLFFGLCYIIFTLIDRIGEDMNNNDNHDFLVTAQIYDKNDPYKQTVLVCDVFNTDNGDEAKKEFTTKYNKKYKIVNIFSSVKVKESE